jgi:two-component system CheB/CheR fusion protein
LDAVSRLFAALPAHSVMVFIVVQHLEPSHKSLMAELLTRHTAMPVAEATEGASLSPDTITIIPPGRDIILRGGVLHLSVPRKQHGVRLPFDTLLISLAQVCGPRTIAIVLSGTGKDGSIGMVALKAAGSHIIAQQPEEADYDGMARSAIATEQVDLVLSLAAMPAALARIASGGTGPVTMIAHPASCPKRYRAGPLTILSSIWAQPRRMIFADISRDHRAQDRGRMSLLCVPRGDYAAYLALLRQQPAERDLLARDMLINVTAFSAIPKCLNG